MTSRISKETVLENLKSQYDISFVEHFQNNDARVLLFGGAPRDMILGRKWKDADFCICLPTEAGDKDTEAERIFKLAGISIQSKTPLGSDKTVFRFKDLQSGGLIDVRVVNDIWAGGADFTVNALRYDLKTGEFIDKYDSISDIEDGVIKTLGDADTAFREGHYLVERALKAVCQLGFEIQDDVRAAMKEYAWQLERDIDFIIDDESDFAEWVLSNLFAGLRYNPQLYLSLMREIDGIHIISSTLAKRLKKADSSSSSSEDLAQTVTFEDSISSFMSIISRNIDGGDAASVFEEGARLMKITKPKKGDDFIIDISRIRYIS